MRYSVIARIVSRILMDRLKFSKLKLLSGGSFFKTLITNLDNDVSFKLHSELELLLSIYICMNTYSIENNILVSHILKCCNIMKEERRK